MKKIIKTTLIGMGAALLMATPAFADETTTKSTWYCYTNSYGQESCTENKTEIEKFEHVVVRELSTEEAEVINEGVSIQEHIPLDTALTPGQIAPLMTVMLMALAGVAYKIKHNA